MSDSDKMRAEFEKWADKQCMSLTRINWKCGTVSEYAYTATFDAWNVWQAAYAAGQKAEREELANLRQEVLRVAQKSWDEPSTTEGER
jgi:hypothetical protein